MRRAKFDSLNHTIQVPIVRLKVRSVWGLASLLPRLAADEDGGRVGGFAKCFQRSFASPPLHKSSSLGARGRLRRAHPREQVRPAAGPEVHAPQLQLRAPTMFQQISCGNTSFFSRGTHVEIPFARKDVLDIRVMHLVREGI